MLILHINAVPLYYQNGMPRERCPGGAVLFIAHVTQKPHNSSHPSTCNTTPRTPNDKDPVRVQADPSSTSSTRLRRHSRHHKVSKMPHLSFRMSLWISSVHHTVLHPPGQGQFSQGMQAQGPGGGTYDVGGQH